MSVWLTPDNSAAFERLTTPALAQALHRIKHPGAQEPLLLVGSILAVGTFFAAQPAALAVLRPGLEQSVEVLSLVVSKPFRRLGLASELLRWIQEQALSMGFRSLFISYPLGDESNIAMKRLTDPRRGWECIEGLRLFRFDRCGAQALLQRIAPMVQYLYRSNRYSLVPWSDLEIDAQQGLGEQLYAPQWSWPSQEDHITNFDSLDEKISAILLDRGVMSGWVTAHRVGDSLLRITKLWVIPAHQGKGTGMLLLNRAVQHYINDCTYISGCFGVNPKNNVMMKICTRYIEPLSVSVQKIRRCLFAFL